MNVFDPSSRLVELTITDRSGTTKFELQHVRTVNELCLPAQSLRSRDVDRWPHVRTLPVETYTNAVPKILIGQDNWELCLSREVRQAKGEHAVASLTALGWAVHGRTLFTKGVKRHSTYTTRTEESSRDRNDWTEIHQQIKEYFSLDSIGIANNRKKDKHEERAMSLLDERSTHLNGRWETCLLWKDPDATLPKNYGAARGRLENLERKLDRDPTLKQLYHEQIENLLSKGYARELTTDDLSNERTWYLPHFGVTNPNKPGKLRLVFDAAAKSRGVSLNDKLLTGPDLLRNLPGVLMQFRQKPIAIKGDIREMFLQVKIISEDQPSQRFLWRGERRNGDPTEYVMTSMIFGATSSPCTAMYVKNRNAERFREQYPQAANAVVNKHYMDDYLDSVDTVDEARRMLTEVSLIHREGGFDIRSWASNDPEVLQGVPTDHLATNSINMSLQEEYVEKTLGLRWDQKRDAFVFRVNTLRIPEEIVNGRRSPTKREMLRVIMSLFDPLGFLSTFTIRSKILLQDVWRSGVTWDEPLKTLEYEKWRSWISDLRSLDDCFIPRCYTRTRHETTELHVFCDASEKAYAAVAYWRFVSREEIQTAFIMGKARVAPVKPSTVPRLELQAALIGSRLARYIETEHEIRVARRVFWTDSQTVLQWIQGDPKNHKSFVAHRLGEISEITEPSEWKWIPSNHNPADDATRDTPIKIQSNMRWLSGPKFLATHDREWGFKTPNQPQRKPEPEKVVLTTTRDDWCLPDVKRFSSWMRLIRSTATILFVADRCRKTRANGPTSTHMAKAERLWVLKCQEEDFGPELRALKRGQPIPNKSRIIQFTPYIDKEGLIRVGGRTNAAENVEAQAKTPILLSGTNPYTRLLIAHYHAKTSHGGPEMVINELRQRYWVPQLRRNLRSVTAQCLPCKIRRAKPSIPRMGDLPTARLTHHQRPFTHCGVDYFGPMTVTVGRRHEKRWGVLFTCLTTRAVHLELANSLSADSAVMAIRRMAARRGYPSHMYSDNGTNLRGADVELKTAINNMKQADISTFASTKNFEWHFIPPSAPHMGGAWERLIRCIKVALKITLKERAPKEECLRTLLSEAEHIVNSRPLTHVSVDHRDEEALTPNHFLIGSSHGNPTPGAFYNSDLVSRKQWRTAQRLTDMFWGRWVREYLPTLNQRPKWNRETKPIEEGEVVLIGDNTMPRNVWPKGVISKLLPGTDGRVRVVELRTARGILRRPTSKIIRLPPRSLSTETVSVPGGSMSAIRH